MAVIDVVDYLYEEQADVNTTLSPPRRGYQSARALPNDSHFLDQVQSRS